MATLAVAVLISVATAAASVEDELAAEPVSELVELEPVELEPVELEPVDVEPVELEPVEVEPVEVEPVELEPVEVLDVLETVVPGPNAI